MMRTTAIRRPAASRVPRLSGVILLVAFALIFAVQSTFAQENSDERETKQTAAMGQKVYTKLTEAQELIEQKKYNEGLTILKEIERLPNLTTYERAQLYNYFAYTYFTMERYRDSIDAYKKVLREPELPEALEQNTLYTLAQLYFTVEDYKSAVQTIEKWFTKADKPTETAYLLLGQGYYQIGEFRKSVTPIDKGIAMVKERGEKPSESLYLLKRAAFFELKDYKGLVSVMRELIRLYPKKEHWMTLAGAHSELGDTKKQMVIMEVLYEAGELTSANQIKNLANLYLLHEAPVKAAQLLDKHIADGTLEKDVQNLRLLAQAWQQAKEDEKSIEPLTAAAARSSDGDMYVRLGQAYINLDRYSEAVDALRKAIEKGDLRRPDQAHIMLGLSLFEMEKFRSARDAFRIAERDKRSQKAASQWIAYINSELERREALSGDTLMEDPEEMKEAVPEAPPGSV